MTNNINLFKGAKGDPYVIPQADLDQALTDYVNGHPTDFVKKVNGKSNVVVLNQGDIQSGPVSGTTATLTGALNAASAVLSGTLSAMSASFTGLNCTSGLSTKNLLATGTTTLTGSTTLTGDLTGNNASFNGTLSANTLSLTGSNSLLQVQGGTIRATNGKISTLGTDILIENQYIRLPSDVIAPNFHKDTPQLIQYYSFLFQIPERVKTTLSVYSNRHLNTFYSLVYDLPSCLIKAEELNQHSISYRRYLLSYISFHLHTCYFVSLYILICQLLFKSVFV